MDYVEEVLEGSPRAVARLISWLEDEDERAYPCMEQLYPHTGKAYVIGITGSPGAGKSTLTDRLTYACGKKGSPWASWPSIPPARLPAERCSATGCA